MPHGHGVGLGDGLALDLRGGGGALDGDAGGFVHAGAHTEGGAADLVGGAFGIAERERLAGLDFSGIEMLGGQRLLNALHLGRTETGLG